MKHLIQPRVQAIQLSGIRQFFNLVADRPGLVSLTIGQPDFPNARSCQSSRSGGDRRRFHDVYSERRPAGTAPGGLPIRR
ncbi:putative N-acetyl-LL-diaminopimelate aminotransferase [Geobacillus sp. BCO2]|nr:putative N-acetyl-LL-diaminopimelate aminotransferase [Geobacillus sp. BCO2]